MSLINIVMAQINPIVGDIEGNTQQVIDSVLQAQRQHQAHVVVFPELTLCGYPPEDLLLRDSMTPRIDNALERLAQQDFSSVVVVGYPKRLADGQYNMAGVLSQGEWLDEYAKQYLPNYQVFDEERYFSAGQSPCIVTIHNVPIALSICEDIWYEQPMRVAKAHGAKMLISINASPFHQRKQQQRLTLVGERARQGQMPIVYVNQVGGQDDLVFDGGSFAIDAQGHCQVQAPLYEEGLFLVQCDTSGEDIRLQPCSAEVPELSDLAVIYQALVLGLRDYVSKNHFSQVVLGLSGGIDSALTLAIAVDALGAKSVHAVMMPFLYTSQLSQDDAQAQAKCLGVSYDSITIEPMYNAFMSALESQFKDTSVDLTEQNLQARCRGVLLMAMSNKKGSLVLTTGNKSELAVGYSTLYGDMAGGFDVLKDVPKTLVFELAKYCNQNGQDIIPASVIERPPSAELAPDQKDEDNLPPYPVLDQILEYYIEKDQSAQAIIAQGFDHDTVHKVIKLVDINEYKRRQAPVGVRISERGFGRDRRYPITNGWKSGI